MLSPFVLGPAECVRSVLRLVIPLPMILALPQFSSGATYNKEAFLPAESCYCADISPDGNVIYAAGQFGDWDAGVRLYDASICEHIKDIHSFPDVPKYILASADGIHLYTTAYYQGAVAKIRVSDGAVVKSISVGPWPVGMVFDSARRYLYVMVNCPYPGAVGSISIIDTSTDTVVGTIGPIVHAGTVLAISPDDQFLYALSFDYEGNEPQTLYKMTIADRSVQAVPGVRVGGISVSPDGQLLYVGDRFAGVVRVFLTSSMTETTSIPIPDVHSFWAAPSGDHGLAVCLAPGSSELLIRVVGLPGREVLQTLSQTLELPDNLSFWPFVDPIFWSRATGEALIPIFRVHGGVIVLSPAEEPWQVVYQSDFSTDPGWTTNAPQNFYWNQTADNYYFKRQNGSEQYSYKSIAYDSNAAYRLEFDACLTRCDWAADLFLSLSDPDMHIASATTWQVSYHNVDQGKTASLIYYDSEGDTYHPGQAQPAPFELNTWYHTVAAYDPAAGTLSLRVTKVSDGSLVGGQDLTGVGSFAGVDRLSISAVGHTYASGAIAEGYIDNLVLKKYSATPEVQVVYQTDFSADPGWITDQPSNYYWNQTAETYHARVENNAPAYSPNRYFYTPVTWTGDSFEIQWDIKMTRGDWSAGVSFGLFDENIAFAGWGGGQGVCLEFANPDAGRLLWLYICGAGGLASASSPGGSYSLDTLYTCKLSYDEASGRIYAELWGQGSATPIWSKTLAVPGGFTQPLTKLGGSRSGFGETGYGGVNRWGVAEAEIDNVVFKRAGAGPLPPVVTQLAINGGALTTGSPTVTLNNTAENNPTHYMAGESSEFTGAAWETYSTAPQFTLGAGDGQKTVHFKTKNAAGESNVVTDSISLQQAAGIYKLIAFLPAYACYSADVSPDGNVIYASVHLGDWDEGVRLYDAHTYALIRDIHSLPKVPKYILASADGIHLYATAYYQGTVAKVRISDGAVVKSISVGPWPVGMVFDSARRYLYVMVNCPYSGAVGSISIIDTSTDTVAGTIGPVVNAGTVLAISPDDQFLYAIGSGAQTLYKMSTAERSVVSTLTGVQAGGISVSPDGALLYVADRAAGAVRVFQTNSMTETTPIPVADVNGFWVAPSGDRALAVCLAPGSSELLIRVVRLPGGEVLQTLSQALELPDGLSSYPLVDPVFWNRTTGEALIPIFRVYGGVIVISPAGVGPAAPVVTLFAINGGAATTESRSVALNNTVENNPTHYMASESPEFTGAAWETYSTAPQFILSFGDGQKTVYFKTKNAVGESDVASDTIQLITSVPPGPEITTTSLPDGVAGHLYDQSLQVSGGVSPYTWSIAAGKLPDGLSLDPSTGIISGTPTDAATGTSTFIVRVRDSQSTGDTIYVFGGLHEDLGNLSSVEKYDPVADAWTFVSPMNQLRFNHGFATDDQGRIYAIGGTWYGGSPTATVERYDPSGDMWEYVAPCPEALCSSASFTLGGEIYVVGGWIDGRRNACLIYSPGTNTWREGPSMYEALDVAGATVSLSETPYVIGGEGPALEARDRVAVLVQEGTELVWEPTTPLLSPRSNPAVAAGLDGYVYAIGGAYECCGRGHTNTAERFNEATNTWESIQAMGVKRMAARAVTDSQGRIWAVGGIDGTSPVYLDSVERYDPAMGSWTTMASHLNTGRAGHGIAIVHGQGQTDEQELSITILPQGPWRTAYSTDFSSDPKWMTNDSANLSWDSATETFHGWQSNADGTHAYTPIEPTSGSSFRLEFDVRINSIEWSAGLTFGLFDSRLMYNAGAVIEYGYFDVGYTIALYAGNPSGPPDWDVANWETGVWYRNLILYDAESKVITLEVRRRDDGTLIAQLSLSGISSFPPGMSFLGTSRVHMAGYNDAAVDFSLDNIVLEEFYQPPKREIEILPLAGPLLRIRWDSEVGKEYQLWTTSDVCSGDWTPIGPRMGGTGGKLYVDDYVEGNGCRFYRVEIISPVAEGPDYAVVVSESTAATDGWDDVVNALVSKHTAPVLSYSGSPFPAAVRDELAALQPRYVCFVAQPAEVTDAFVTNVHELTRQIDEDLFGDCIWGIITGAKPEDAMRLASASSPLEIEGGLLKAGGFLEWLPAGVFHSEGDSGTMWVKELDREIDKRTDGPLDDTESLVAGLNTGLYQLFVTSGHASEYNYQLHWPDPDGEGFFFSYDGQLYANDHNGTRFDINNPQPIVYWAPGNCLIGRIAGPYSMALGWLGSGKAVQFCGYVVPTWYGYMGWGLSDYFLKPQDRFSFAEAFFLTNQALIFDQLKATPGTDPEGLAYDKNAVVLYGDPALRAVVSRCRAPLYNQTMEATATPDPDQFRFVLTITMNEVAEVPRPVIAFLPFKIVPSETVLEQSEAQAVEITDDMVLAQVWVQGQPSLPAGERIRVMFTCVRAS